MHFPIAWMLATLVFIRYILKCTYIESGPIYSASSDISSQWTHNLFIVCLLELRMDFPYGSLAGKVTNKYTFTRGKYVSYNDNPQRHYKTYRFTDT